MELSQIQKKKGIQLNQAFGAVLAVVLIGVLVVIAIFLYVQLGSTFTPNSAADNATDELIDQFATFPALVGLVGTIVFLGLVIGVLVSAFVFGRGSGV